MKNRKLAAWGISGLALVCLLGVARAGTSRFVERRKALLAQLEAERKRLGLTDRVALFAKYPTPEIQLCRAVRLAPGSEADVVIGGKFATGTKVLFENDAIEALTEAVTPTGYRARIRVRPGVGPTVASAHLFAPVSGGHAQCLAVYVGGKYEWEFTAQNGWRIKLLLLDEKFQPGSSSPPNPEYRVEFYRGAETKPFETRTVGLSISSAPWDDTYTGSLSEQDAGAVNAQAQMERIAKQFQDPKLTDQQRDKLMKEMERLTEAMVKQQQAAIAQMQSPGYAQEIERKRAEFGCQYIQFKVKPEGINGDMTCGQKVGTLTLKGTMKFLGL